MQRTHPELKDIPYIVQQEKILQGLISFLPSLNMFERRFWDHKELEERFGQESARTTLKKKEVYPISSSLSLTMVTADFLYFQQGLHTNILVEDVYDKRSERMRKHFLLQVPMAKNNLAYDYHLPFKEQNFTIDFAQRTIVKFYRGSYENAHGFNRSYLTVVDTPLDPTKNFQENFGKQFPTFTEDLYREINYLKSIDTPEFQEKLTKEYAAHPLFKVYYGR
jgi:hypothetical protein